MHPGHRSLLMVSPFTVYSADLLLDAIDAKINAIAALSDATPIGYLALGLGSAALFADVVTGVVRSRVRTA